MTALDKIEERNSSPTNLWQILDGHYQAWYPVELSSELAKGERKGLDFCDGKIVLYRGEDGIAHASSARCPHLGASLAVGKVIGNEIQCGFHHWQYGSDGKCTLIPSGDRIPPGARILSFPIEERYGVLWVFFGREALFDLPAFPDFSEDTYVWKSIRLSAASVHCDPWMFGANIVDFQHIHTLHGMPGFHPEVTWHEFGPEWSAKMARDDLGAVSMNVRMWGVNSVLSTTVTDDGAVYYLAGQAPLGPMGTVTIMSVGAKRGPGAAERVEEHLRLQSTLIAEDVPILTTIEPGPSVLSAGDRDLVKFIRYARAFPRARMAELEADVRRGVHPR